MSVKDDKNEINKLCADGASKSFQGMFLSIANVDIN